MTCQASSPLQNCRILMSLLLCLTARALHSGNIPVLCMTACLECQSAAHLAEVPKLQRGEMPRLAGGHWNIWLFNKEQSRTTAGLPCTTVMLYECMQQDMAASTMIKPKAIQLYSTLVVICNHTSHMVRSLCLIRGVFVNSVKALLEWVYTPPHSLKSGGIPEHLAPRLAE